MPTHLASQSSGAAARLLIHADAGDVSPRWSVEALIQRLRARKSADCRHAGHAPIGLEVQDLEGHRLLSLDVAGPLVEVALSPGTYHVCTGLGGARRSYTVALGPGATFDLHLRPTGGDV